MSRESGRSRPRSSRAFIARSPFPARAETSKRKARRPASPGAARTASISLAPAAERSPAASAASASRRLIGPTARPGRRASLRRARPLLVLGDVEAEILLVALGARLLLLGVLEPPLAEVERDVLRQPVLAAGTAGRDRGDDEVLEVVDHVLERLVARGLADVEPAFRDVRPLRAELDQLGRGDVHELGDRQVLEVRLA